MKILFTATYYAPYVSGLTIHAQRLAEQLVKRKHRVNILTTQFDKSLPSQTLINKVKVLRTPYLFRISKGFFMPTYIFTAFHAVRLAEVVVVNLPQFEGFIVSLVSFFLRKPLYIIYHCEVKLPKSFGNTYIEYMLHGGNLISLLLSTKIITYTKDYAKNSRLLTYFLKKTIYIYPPIVVMPENKKTTKKFLHIIKKRPKYVIGVAARIAAEKGIEYLFDSIPLLEKKLKRDFLIIIAGPKNPVGEEAYWKSIAHYLVKYNKYIFFLGTLSAKKIRSFYALLDVLVLPSTNSTEAFGIVQVEAMLCGVPVVASDLPGVRVPIQVTRMGELTPVKDSVNLAQKISQVLLNKNRYVKNRYFIEQQFSFNDTIKKYENIFAGLS